VLADHARRSDDIEPDVVQETKDAAIAKRDQFPDGDHRRAYYDEKIRWCDLLLSHA
jgi:F-type H+-transporting ATPase subunit epsilon